MAIKDAVFSASRRRESEKVASIVNNVYCPSCGKGLKDVTEDFYSSRIDLSKTTCFFVITTDVIKAAGRCSKNYRYKGYHGGQKI